MDVGIEGDGRSARHGSWSKLLRVDVAMVIKGLFSGMPGSMQGVFAMASMKFQLNAVKLRV